ncbi:MAG: serine--tRNA ligase [Propionibacteriales bacterium]|nr:serine--tRNA ligase [Propionibacteriales bacterium]
MIDIDLIRKRPDWVHEQLRKRADDVEIEPILDADRRRRELLQQVESARAERKQLSKEIGRRRGAGEDTTQLQEESTKIGDRIDTMSAELSEVEPTLNDLLLRLPNIADERVPAGDKEGNQVVRTWGEQPDLGDKPLDHVELCTRLGLVDYERGTKLGGRGFWIYTGFGAMLEWALVDFFAREHLADGYTFVLPPHLLNEESGYAAGQFPKFYDDVFHLEPTDRGAAGLFLIPTAETAILNIYRDEILDPADMPLKLFAYTPCYRREAGSHRTAERGTIRGHQFNKVEMFQFCTPEQSDAALEELVEKSERLVQKLGLHHRTSLLAARDASAAMALTYDIEVWIPSIADYKEVSSASWARDYQARRARIRYRRTGEKGTEYIHTLNASGLATSRLVPAIVEQSQQPDGSVVVPEPLRAWLGTDVLRPS